MNITLAEVRKIIRDCAYDDFFETIQDALEHVEETTGFEPDHMDEEVLTDLFNEIRHHRARPATGLYGCGW